MIAKLGFAAAILSLISCSQAAFLSSGPSSKLSLSKLDSSDSAKPLSLSKLSASSLSDMVSRLISLDAASADGVDDDELVKMEGYIQELVTKGDDDATRAAVKQLSAFIQKVLIPSRLRAQKSDQKWLDMTMQQLQNCDPNERADTDPVVKEKLDIAQSHQEEYQEKRAAHASCVEVLEAKKLLSEAYCTSVDSHKVCACDHKMLKAFGNQNRDCSNAPEVAPEDQKCCDSFYEREMQHVSCTEADHTAQYSEKQHGIIMTKLCKNFDYCYDHRFKALQDLEKAVKEKETRRTWEVVFRIECLLESFKSGKVSQSAADACKAKRQETLESRRISYPVVPSKGRCGVQIPA